MFVCCTTVSLSPANLLIISEALQASSLSAERWGRAGKSHNEARQKQMQLHLLVLRRHKYCRIQLLVLSISLVIDVAAGMGLSGRSCWPHPARVQLRGRRAEQVAVSQSFSSILFSLYSILFCKISSFFLSLSFFARRSRVVPSVRLVFGLCFMRKTRRTRCRSVIARNLLWVVFMCRCFCLFNHWNCFPRRLSRTSVKRRIKTCYPFPSPPFPPPLLVGPGLH